LWRYSSNLLKYLSIHPVCFGECVILKLFLRKPRDPFLCLLS
jgi:hypothetical protein